MTMTPWKRLRPGPGPLRLSTVTESESPWQVLARTLGAPPGPDPGRRAVCPRLGPVPGQTGRGAPTRTRSSRLSGELEPDSETA